MKKARKVLSVVVAVAVAVWVFWVSFVLLKNKGEKASSQTQENVEQVTSEKTMAQFVASETEASVAETGGETTVRQAEPEVKAQAVTSETEFSVAGTEGETTIDVVLPKVRYIVPPPEVVVQEFEEKKVETLLTSPAPAITPLVPVVTSTPEQRVEITVVPDVPSPPAPQKVVIHPKVRLVHRAPPPEKIYWNSQP